METIARVCLPLWRGRKSPRINFSSLIRSFGDALELYRRALFMAYGAALVVSFDERNECLPDDNLEGRDPRW